MEVSSDRAQKIVGNELSDRGVDGRTAVLAGQKVADYVYNYSAYPYNVYKRILGQAEGDVDMEDILAKAKQAQEKARPIHAKLKATGYRSL